MSEGCIGSSWLGRVGETYNMLWKMVIRPPRDLYTVDEMGPSRFGLGPNDHFYVRKDLQLESRRGKLECSHFLPCPNVFREVPRPCVVYLHGNCSSRIEAFDVMPVLVSRGITLFSLDLSGSGRSDGEYISLGHHEEQDLEVVLDYLRSQTSVSAIGVWGRSMGATTAILRAAEDPTIGACVLDSAFMDLPTVAEELVARGRFPIPHFLVSWALDLIRTEVIARADFDPLELTPIDSATRATCPALFAVAYDDTFVLPHHTQDLHDAWAGERSLRVFDGGHNGVRPTWFILEAADFFFQQLVGTGEVIDEHWNRSNLLELLPKRPRSKDKHDLDKRTPRLVSPLTEELNLNGDADAAAGPSNGQKGSRRRALASQLQRIGYGRDASLRAVQHASSLEDALAWLNQNPAELLEHWEVGRPSRRKPPTKTMPCGKVAPGTSIPVPSEGESGESVLPAEEGASGGEFSSDFMDDLPPPCTFGPTVAYQLKQMGFTELEAETAARRSLTLEAALEYLSAQHVSIHL